MNPSAGSRCHNAHSSNAKSRRCSLMPAMLRWPFASVLFGLSLGVLPMPTQGENPFEFGSTPGKLPKQVLPTQYAIRIVPNVEAKTFAGTALIKITVNQPVRQLVMNALELNVSGAVIDEKA